jgi:hypothetical protein
MGGGASRADDPQARGNFGGNYVEDTPPRRHRQGVDAGWIDRVCQVEGLGIADERLRRLLEGDAVTLASSVAVAVAAALSSWAGVQSRLQPAAPATVPRLALEQTALPLPAPSRFQAGRRLRSMSVEEEVAPATTGVASVAVAAAAILGVGAGE